MSNYRAPQFRLFKGKEYRVSKYKVEDGDTIKISVDEEFSQSSPKHLVRLYGIDAPEHGQSTKGQSWSKLKNLCQRADYLTVRIIESDDLYGRPVGIFYAHCENWAKPLDLNRTMVIDGFAYAFPHDDKSSYWREDCEAKDTGAGIRLQMDLEMPPWEWRERGPKEPYYKRFIKK